MTYPYTSYLCAVGIVMSGAIAPTAKADVPLSSVAESIVATTSLVQRRNDIELADTRADGLSQTVSPSPSPPLVQVPSELVTVTDIQLTPTDTGVDVQLLTSDGQALPTGEPTQRGNALIVDIPNAVLALPNDEAFEADNPVAGIESVTITQQQDTVVRLEIIGQTAPPSATTNTNPTGAIVSTALAQRLDDVVVRGRLQRGSRYAPADSTTATRVSAPLQDIPQSIRVVPRQVFEDRQSTRIEDALRNVSGVTFSGTDLGRTTEFNIRGFDDDAPLLRNGFNQFGAGGTIPDLANLERIEVLKGPVAELYGEVEPGGAINLVTKRPLSEPAYTLQAQFGNRELIRPSLDLTGPLTDDGSLAYRLNAVYQSGGDFLDVDTDTERFFIAPVITWAIDENTDFTVELEYLDEERPPVFGVPAIGDSIADIPFDRVTNELDDVSEERSLTIGYDLEHRFNESWRIRNGFRYAEQDSSIEIAFPFSVDESTGEVFRFWGFQPEEARSYSFQTNAVGDFETGPIDHVLLLGLDLNRTEDNFNWKTRLDLDTPLPLNIFDPEYGTFERPDADDLPLIQDDVTQTDRLGVFLQDSISFTDNFILLAGVRYDVIDQTTTINPTAFDPGRSEIDQLEDKLSPRFGLVYKPIPEVSLFANYSQSFAPNPETTAEGEPLDFEEGEGFEAGIKSALFDERLFVSAAYFNITKENVASVDPDDPFSFIATGEQQSQGVELDVVGEILPGWDVIATYAYIDAEVSEDTAIDDGNRLPNAPEHSASLWTTYEIQSGDFKGLSFGLGFDYVGEREGDLDNSFQLDDYFLTNIALSYRRNYWKAALTARNLFDVDYIAGSSLRERGNDPGEPFTILGSLSLEF